MQNIKTFLDKISLRTMAKSTLLKVVCSSLDYTNLPCSVVVRDVGYLQQALVWTKPTILGDLLESYKNYVTQHFCTHLRNVVVVFDGYGRVVTTEAEKQRCSPSQKSGTVIVSDNNTTVCFTS